ncbi:DNA replication factor Cdt1 [Thalassophryne amazonica]|uniref:DNA replication factor Cdt1 n=1 Tax=Thalassophryne amazonica TaxID=390379 RepID=UPI0014712336|nr:DNA replication factor Cdt1 [Thalassophryne amazonica]
MSQARVTEFFCQRKSVAARRAAAKPRVLKAADAVHQEFVKVIDEAAGLTETESAVSNPRTPKRTSGDCDPGAAALPAAAHHSTAKRRRRVPADKRNVRQNAAKKLVFLSPEPEQQQSAVQVCDGRQQSAPAPPVEADCHGNVQTSSAPRQTGVANKVLCKEDIEALKSCLQRIKKHSKEITAAASSASGSSDPSSSNDTASKNVPAPPTSDARVLTSTLVRAKALAASVQRRKADEPKQSESQDQDSVDLPAYQRYHTLAQAAPPGLSLPYQYRVLAEMFRSMDTVVSMLYNRSETATFIKIKQAVQDMMHKRFEESHLGQIKTVFPEAYTFRQENNIPVFSSTIKKGDYHLTVEPNLHSDQNEARPLLLASQLLERRQIFHCNLVSMVKDHHKVFLSSLVPPVSVPEDKLTRWHPRFNVDTVPSVPASLLPQPPHSNKLATAQEVLDRARALITPKMETALKSVALKTEDDASDSRRLGPAPNGLVPSPDPATEVPPALKGVSQSLLDRIRAKEAQKMQAAMTRNPAQEERLLMMSRLCELARILRNVFVAEKKMSLIMEVACNRMVTSYRSALSVGEMEKHVRLLAEVTPDWLTVHPVRKDFYLKLNKTLDLTIVLDKLSARLKEEEQL